MPQPPGHKGRWSRRVQRRVDDVRARFSAAIAGRGVHSGSSASPLAGAAPAAPAGWDEGLEVIEAGRDEADRGPAWDDERHGLSEDHASLPFPLSLAAAEALLEELHRQIPGGATGEGRDDPREIGTPGARP